MYLQVGQLFNERYEVLRDLGHGSMGSVYQVKDLKRDGLLCALKILQEEHSSQGSPSTGALHNNALASILPIVVLPEPCCPQKT